MREISLNISANKQPIFQQIYNYFKNEILDGTLQCGDYLPSLRGCAKSLEVSKNTIESAYQLLVSDGYVENIPKKGYQIIYQGHTPAYHQIRTGFTEPSSRPISIDFRYGNVELGSFPFHLWNKMRNTWIAHNQSSYMVEGNSQGEYKLRKELSRLLYESRGVKSSPEQIIIGAAPQQLVSLLCQLLDPTHHIVGVENPGYDGARNTFVNHGFTVCPIPLTENGMSIEVLDKSKANVLYVSPSQQFANKMTLSHKTRERLADWAHSNSYIIEDDYEWEFKYQDGYIPSIQSLFPEKVIYIGRVSKTLLPLFNLSYAVLPYEMLSLFHSKITEYDQPVSRLDQLSFSQFLHDGYWYKHLQKMREQYREKRNILFSAVAEHMKHLVSIEGKDTGLHAFLTIKTKLTEDELLALALKKEVKVYGTSRYWFGAADKYPTVLLGYGALSSEEIYEGIKRLAEAWLG